MKRFYGISILLVAMVFAGGTAVMAADPSNFAEVTPGDGVVYFTTDAPYETLNLGVSAPGGAQYEETFKPGEEVYYKLIDECGEPLPDGVFRYRIMLRPVLDEELRKLLDQASANDEMRASCEARYLPNHVPELQTTWEQTGTFRIESGKFVETSGINEKYFRGDGMRPEDGPLPEDHLVYDDAIITGSICVGFDCANGESFGYCTQKFKENNLHVCFEDTSIGSFPTTDWKIQINDTTSNGASYFTIWDLDASRRPFTIEAGAPAHALYVEDYGRIGFGTSIPYVELHMKDGDTPTIRLDQDGSSGWVAQSWDIAGNETNFFVRDVTNGSKLSFRIQPNTPSSTLSLRSTGFVGIGTWDPAWKLDIFDTGSNARVAFHTTSTGSTNADGSLVGIDSDGHLYLWNFESRSIFFGVDNDSGMILESSGELAIGRGSATHPIHMGAQANNSYLASTGVWHDSSSREYKENIEPLRANDAFDALDELEPVRYNYKVDGEDEYVGFIAEDVPELVATKDRKTMVPMDVVAVLTKVVQEQRRDLDSQRMLNEEQVRLIETQRRHIAELQARMTSLETSLTEK